MKGSGKYWPSFVKSLARFIVYKAERRRFFREPAIVRQQNDLIRQHDEKARKLILFMIAGADRETGSDKISGGTISIVSLCEESARLKHIHGAEVLLCTFPGDFLLLKHTQFKNDSTVFRFGQLPAYFKDVRDVLIHIPEYLCSYFIKTYNAGEMHWVQQIANVRFNILNQNIQYMPPVEDVKWLREHARQVTITTAHQQYCNTHYRNLYGVPLHKFSVWISPEKYFFREYPQKENMIIVSPDDHPMRETVLQKLATVKGLEIVVIRNLSYEQYKQTISRAKWALTFGEGLDGYIIESVFSGAIGFAVYNEDFFTKDFKDLPTIYDSYDDLLEHITVDIAKLDAQPVFKQHHQPLFDICASLYSQDEYKNNISQYYQQRYTYP